MPKKPANMDVVIPEGAAASRMKGRQLQVSIALPPEYVTKLKELSEMSHEPVAYWFREALRDLFEKHKRLLRRR